MGVKKIQGCGHNINSGIEPAKQLGLAQSGIVDVVVLPYLHEMISIFDPAHEGHLLCFAVQ